MAMIDCKECGGRLSDKAAACVTCGAPNPSYRKPMSGVTKVLLSAIGLAVAVLGFGFFVSATDPTVAERARDRDAIKYCKAEYDRVAGDPAMSAGARTVARDACKLLEMDYRAKWNREP